MSTPKSVPETKSHFLRSQIRLLSSPLRTPSTDAWPSLPPSSTDSTVSSSISPSPLPSKLLEEVSDKINNKLKSHNRMVFSSQSQRHVVEQIDALYWSDVIFVIQDEEGRLRGEETNDDVIWINKDLDFGEQSNVRGLPETLGEARLGVQTIGVQHDENRAQEQRYIQLRKRLVELTNRKQELAQKVAAYRKLRQLLIPYEDAKESVQPNLVVRDGELERELEKMRVLVARVGSKIKNEDVLLDNKDDERNEEIDERQKLMNILGLG